jgi:AcrR family transcriptional regulator
MAKSAARTPQADFDAAATDPISARIIDAAIAEFTDHGLRRVTVDDIARRAGLHRVTVYKRFSSKDELTVAAMLTWVRRYFVRINDSVDGLPPVEALVEGFVQAMLGMRDDPLVRRLLTVDTETTLPYLTIKGGPAIAVLRAFMAEQVRDADIPDLEGAAEIAARIGLSFLLTPDSHFQLRTADDIRAFAQSHLIPLLGR